MLVKALVSFSGTVSMGLGEVKEIKDKATAKDLLSCGYVELVDKETPVEKVKKAGKKVGGDL